LLEKQIRKSIEEGVGIKKAYNDFDSYKIKALDEEYKDVLEEVRAIEEERIEFLKEEVDLDLKTVKVDDMPDISEDNQYPHWQIWAVLETIVVDD